MNILWKWRSGMVRPVIQTLVIIILFVGLAFWATRQVSLASDWLDKSFSTTYVWYGLGIVAAFFVIFWIARAYRTRAWRGAGSATATSAGIGRVIIDSLWGIVVVALGVIVGVGVFWMFYQPAPQGVQAVTAAAPVSAVRLPADKITPSTPFTDFNLIVRPGKPGKLTIPVMWRWDWAGPIPKGWTTTAYLDAGGNRIQVFEVVSPATEVTLAVRLSKCATRQECAW